MAAEGAVQNDTIGLQPLDFYLGIIFTILRPLGPQILMTFRCCYRITKTSETLSRSKLQHRSESNSVAIELSSLPGKIFLASDWDFWGKIGKKGGYFGLGMGPFIGPW